MTEKSIDVTSGSESTRINICKETFFIDNDDSISPAFLKALLLLAYKAGQDEVKNTSTPILGHAPK